MPRYLALAENPFDLSENAFDLSEGPNLKNYIFVPGQNGVGGTYQHITRFSDLPMAQFNQVLDALAPFQPAMNEGEFALAEDGSEWWIPGMSASDWKEEKRAQKIADKAAKTAKKNAAANLKNAKAAGVEAGTYESPISKIGSSAVQGAQKLAGSLLGSMVPNFSGSVSAGLTLPPPPEEPKPAGAGIMEMIQNLPTWAKVAGVAGLGFVVYKVATKKKK